MVESYPMKIFIISQRTIQTPNTTTVRTKNNNKKPVSNDPEVIESTDISVLHIRIKCVLSTNSFNIVKTCMI